MANQKTLDPNASPYLQIPKPRLYVYIPPHPHRFLPPVVHPQHLSTYIPFEPAHPKQFFPLPLPRHPSAKKIKLSLTPVPSGPRIPKSRLKLVRICNSNSSQMQWRPKLPDNKPSGVEKIGKRWKNSRKEYYKVLPLETNTTSLMIKNVPNKYTRKLLIKALDEHCDAENKKIKNDIGDYNRSHLSAYDFVYLPIDFNRRLNAGFAFVNFTNPEAALRFREAFHGKRWDLFGCSKIAEISRARIQGKTALINNCKGMNFTHGSEEDRPVYFAPPRDGSGQAASKMITVGKCFYW